MHVAQYVTQYAWLASAAVVAVVLIIAIMCVAIVWLTPEERRPESVRHLADLVRAFFRRRPR